MTFGLFMAISPMRPRVFAAAVIIGLALCNGTPAQACFPCWMWGSQSSPPEKNVYEWPVLSGAASRLPSPDKLVEPYGLRNSQIRRAFDIAYHRQVFRSAWAKDVAFENWKSTIGAATELDGMKSYYYVRNRSTETTNRFTLPERIFIHAQLDSYGTFAFNIEGPSARFAEELGQELGMSADTGAGQFARAFVALGGRSTVTKIYGFWSSGSSNHATYTGLRQSGIGREQAAEETFTGKMVRRFYGMTAAKVAESETQRQIVVTFQQPASSATSLSNIAIPNTNLSSAQNESFEEEFPDLPESDHEPHDFDQGRTQNANDDISPIQ